MILLDLRHHALASRESTHRQHQSVSVTFYLETPGH